VADHFTAISQAEATHSRGDHREISDTFWLGPISGTNAAPIHKLARDEALIFRL